MASASELRDIVRRRPVQEAVPMAVQMAVGMFNKQQNEADKAVGKEMTKLAKRYVSVLQGITGLKDGWVVSPTSHLLSIDNEEGGITIDIHWESDLGTGKVDVTVELNKRSGPEGRNAKWKSKFHLVKGITPDQMNLSPTKILTDAAVRRFLKEHAEELLAPLMEEDGWSELTEAVERIELPMGRPLYKARMVVHPMDVKEYGGGAGLKRIDLGNNSQLIARVRVKGHPFSGAKFYSSGSMAMTLADAGHDVWKVGREGGKDVYVAIRPRGVKVDKAARRASYSTYGEPWELEVWAKKHGIQLGPESYPREEVELDERMGRQHPAKDPELAKRVWSAIKGEGKTSAPGVLKVMLPPKVAAKAGVGSKASEVNLLTVPAQMLTRIAAAVGVTEGLDEDSRRRAGEGWHDEKAMIHALLVKLYPDVVIDHGGKYDFWIGFKSSPKDRVERNKVVMDVLKRAGWKKMKTEGSNTFQSVVVMSKFKSPYGESVEELRRLIKEGSGPRFPSTPEGKAAKAAAERGQILKSQLSPKEQIRMRDDLPGEDQMKAEGRLDEIIDSKLLIHDKNIPWEGVESKKQYAEALAKKMSSIETGFRPGRANEDGIFEFKWTPSWDTSLKLAGWVQVHADSHGFIGARIRAVGSGYKLMSGAGARPPLAKWLSGNVAENTLNGIRHDKGMTDAANRGENLGGRSRWRREDVEENDITRLRSLIEGKPKGPVKGGGKGYWSSKEQKGELKKKERYSKRKEIAQQMKGEDVSLDDLGLFFELLADDFAVLDVDAVNLGEAMNPPEVGAVAKRFREIALGVVEKNRGKIRIPDELLDMEIANMRGRDYSSEARTIIGISSGLKLDTGRGLRSYNWDDFVRYELGGGALAAVGSEVVKAVSRDAAMKRLISKAAAKMQTEAMAVPLSGQMEALAKVQDTAAQLGRFAAEFADMLKRGMKQGRVDVRKMGEFGRRVDAAHSILRRSYMALASGMREDTEDAPEWEVNLLEVDLTEFRVPTPTDVSRKWLAQAVDTLIKGIDRKLIYGGSGATVRPYGEGYMISAHKPDWVLTIEPWKGETAISPELKFWMGFDWNSRKPDIREVKVGGKPGDAAKTFAKKVNAFVQRFA